MYMLYRSRQSYIQVKVVIEMVVAEHFSGAANLNKIDKIPEYVGQFRKEWFFIRGVNYNLRIYVL